jgi:hypothetical protein
MSYVAELLTQLLAHMKEMSLFYRGALIGTAEIPISLLYLGYFLSYVTTCGNVSRDLSREGSKRRLSAVFEGDNVRPTACLAVLSGA